MSQQCETSLKYVCLIGFPKLTRFPQAHSTDVVLCSLCPPRRWSDAGVGIGMLRGISLLSAHQCWMIPLLGNTIGYLMLEDSLGFPYYRLFNI